MMMAAGGIFAMYSLMCKRLGIGQYAHRIPTDVDKARFVSLCAVTDWPSHGLMLEYICSPSSSLLDI